MVQRRASLPSHLEVAIGCAAQGGGHGLAAVWRPWNFVAGGGRSEGHRRCTKATVSVLDDDHGAVVLAVDKRLATGGEDVSLQSAVERDRSVRLEVGALQFSRGRWCGPAVRLEVDQVPCEIVVVDEGPRGAECTAAVVRSVREVEQFDGGLRAAPVVDETHVHGSVHRAEQLCFNGQVPVEHAPGVHGGLQAADEGVVGHLEGAVPEQQLGGGPHGRALGARTEHQRQGGGRERSRRTSGEAHVA